MNTDLMRLAFDRLRQLADLIGTTHDELVKWHQTPLTDVQQTQLTLQLRNSLKEQHQWLNALAKEVEEANL